MKHKDKTKNSRFLKKGFSLIEVLFTLLVLSIGILSVSSLMLSNIKSSQDSKNQIISSMLAQEGVELVINLKYNDSADFSTEIATGDNYIIDHNAMELADIEGSIDNFVASGGSAFLDEQLYLDGGFYEHDNSGTATRFHRKIDLAVEALEKKVTVTSMVTWDDNADAFPSDDDCNIGNKCVSVNSVLLDD